jgi:hypothetical protein
VLQPEPYVDIVKVGLRLVQPQRITGARSLIVKLRADDVALFYRRLIELFLPDVRRANALHVKVSGKKSL